VSNIIRIDAQDDYVYVHEKNETKNRLYAITLTKLAKELNLTVVARVNNYTMVNVSYVDYVEGDEIAMNEEIISLTLRYRKQFFERMEQGM
jgi:DNA-binding LytR/AlgR family response regulator